MEWGRFCFEPWVAVLCWCCFWNDSDLGVVGLDGVGDRALGGVYGIRATEVVGYVRCYFGIDYVHEAKGCCQVISLRVSMERFG